jgi:hypothetical protein
MKNERGEGMEEEIYKSRIESIQRVKQTLYATGNMQNVCDNGEGRFLIKATFDPTASIFLEAYVNEVDILSLYARGKENCEPEEELLFDIFAVSAEELHAFFESEREYAFLMYIP